MPKKKLPIKVNDAVVATFGVSMQGKVLKIGGKVATAGELSQLKGEAQQFRNTMLYQVLMETPKWEAIEVIVNKSDNWQDVLNGKTILHTIGIQENILKILE